MVVMKASHGRLLDQPMAIKHRSWAVNSTLEGQTTTCQKQAHLSHALARSLGRNWCRSQLPTSTATHVPIPHAAVVKAQVDTIKPPPDFRRQFVNLEFAVKRRYGNVRVLDLAAVFDGCRSAIGVRKAQTPISAGMNCRATSL